MNSYRLSQKAKSSPETAALILQTPILRDRLLNEKKENGAEIIVSQTLREIAETYPASAILIFENTFLREKLLNWSSIVPETCTSYTLDKIADAHPHSSQVQSLCEQFRPLGHSRRVYSPPKWPTPR